jgi:dimethylargininase
MMNTSNINKLASLSASHATRFSSAITRRPAASAVNGLRAQDIGTVDIKMMARQHSDYQDALRQAGAVVTELPALPNYPDAQFVEDTALCLPSLAVMMRPKAETRRGEVAPMRQALSTIFDDIMDITDGFVEAGDILTTPSEVLVGLSARTDQAGANQLRTILNNKGYAMRVLKTPSDVLHFKTDCSVIDDNCILSTERLASSGCFDGYQTLIVPTGEDPAANMIRYNDYIIMPAGFSKTEAMLKANGFDVLTVGNTECAKIDGGMSCLSLRF